MRRQTIRVLIFLVMQSRNMSLCFIIWLAVFIGLLWFWLITRYLMLTQFLMNFSSLILIYIQYTSFWTSNLLSLSPSKSQSWWIFLMISKSLRYSCTLTSGLRTPKIRWAFWRSKTSKLSISHSAHSIMEVEELFI